MFGVPGWGLGCRVRVKIGLYWGNIKVLLGVILG